MASDPAFPPGFFDRTDPTDDARFYGADRFVTHIDDRAIAAVGALYDELVLAGRLLDVMSSWVSHLRVAPDELVVLGMNPRELAANRHASAQVVQDLNADTVLAFEDQSFDGAMCAVSVDYLVRPLEVFAEVRRVLKTGAPFVCTFSNRCFPTKAIRGWLATSDEQHCEIVAEYFRRSGGWTEPVAALRTPRGDPGDPLYAVHASATR